MLKPYRLTIWCMTDGALQFLDPVALEVVDDDEAVRTGNALAALLLNAKFADKVMIRLEGEGVDLSIELP